MSAANAVRRCWIKRWRMISINNAWSSGGKF